MNKIIIDIKNKGFTFERLFKLSKYSASRDENIYFHYANGYRFKAKIISETEMIITCFIFESYQGESSLRELLDREHKRIKHRISVLRN